MVRPEVQVGIVLLGLGLNFMSQLCELSVPDSRKGVGRDSCPRWLTGALHWVLAGGFGSTDGRRNWQCDCARPDSSEMRKLSWPLRGRPRTLQCCHLEGLPVAMQPQGAGGKGRPWQLLVGALFLTDKRDENSKLCAEWSVVSIVGSSVCRPVCVAHNDWAQTHSGRARRKMSFSGASLKEMSCFLWSFAAGPSPLGGSV